MRDGWCEDNGGGHFRGVVEIVDRFLSRDEAGALTHYRELITAYATGALLQGLSLREIRDDLDSVQELWGFGPWGALISDGCLYLIANAEESSLQDQGYW